MDERKITRQIKIGAVPVGGNAPVAVQSMTNTDTRDVAATVAQVSRLEAAGCEIIRVAVLDLEAARAIRAIREQINIPLIADIHFDSRLAVAAMENGAQGIRINPGNIGGSDKLARVVAAAKNHLVPIRVGVNSGSVEKDILARHGHPTPAALVESALRNIRRLEELGFQLLATQGTAKVLHGFGVHATAIHKIHEGRPNVLDALSNGQVHLVINTPSGRLPRADEVRIRSMATALGIPCVTTISGAQASITGIEVLRKHAIHVKPLQAYHQELIRVG